MRKIISSIILAFFVSFTLIPIAESIAAEDSTIVGFEIIAPINARANEAIDVTVRAVDRNKNTVTKYTGSIIFISESFGDVVPSPGKAIAFTTDDAGQKKFSKGITFRSAGKQKIIVADIDNPTSLLGEVTITVEPATGTVAPVSTETVTVVTPVQNSKITEDIVVVSGKTKKNSKITFLLNGQDAGSAVSDDTGLFTKSLNDITQEKNILQVQLLDGTNTIVARSEDILFDKITQKEGFYNIIVTPGTTVEASSMLKILIEGDPAMTTSISMEGGITLPLKELEPGKYTLETPAPAAAGSYPIDVLMKSSLGQSTIKTAATTIVVTEKTGVIESQKGPTFSNLKALSKGRRVTFTFSVDNAPADLDAFKIAYGESADSLSQEVITYSSGKIRGADGSYAWYIDNLEPKNYTFKIFGIKRDKSLIQDFASDTVVANIAAPSCTIGNIGNIEITSESGKSILTWTALSGALSYNVYKVSAAGDQQFVQNVTEPKFSVHHTQGAILYNDFVIKALCQGGVESADMSKASGVQTGPGVIAILVILSGIIGVILMRKRSIS